MAYSIKPGTHCWVCKYVQLTYQRDSSRYTGPWRKFKTTRSLHFDAPVLRDGNTYYFADGAWMMRVELSKHGSEHIAPVGVSRLPQVKSRITRDYRPKQRIRRDSEK